MNEEPLKPRFQIKKTKISQEEGGNAAVFEPQKILYVEIDDEITAVYDRIKRQKQSRIALVIPKGAQLLQSIINLKILKRKTDELKKEIAVVTADASYRGLAEKAGITVLANLTKMTTGEKPVPAPLPPMRGQRPQRTQGEKVSLSEVIRQDKTNPLENLLARIKLHLQKRKTAQKTRMVLVAPNKQALFTLVLVSILLLLAIAYIALPGATVYLTPRQSILDPSFNVTFLDFEKNRDILHNPPSQGVFIASFPVRPPPFKKRFTHQATGKLFQGENARGTIVVTNLSNAPWDLAARTRFQTEDGLVFRTPVPLRVPAAHGGSPGTLSAEVIADEFDAAGQVMGERGNIGPRKFFLPGIKNEENKRKLFGESLAPFTGGVSKTVKTVSEQDIAAARATAAREAAKGAQEDLKKFLEEENIMKKTNFSLLTDQHVIRISEPLIEVPADIAGRAQEQFEVTATYSATGMAFDREELISALKERLMTRADPDKKILKVEEGDISYRYLDEDERQGKVRLTATIRAVQIYELDPERENGHRFLKKITDHIAGMRVEQAKTYLEQQTDEIARVEIKTWPVWAPTIPGISENIKFVIAEDSVK